MLSWWTALETAAISARRGRPKKAIAEPLHMKKSPLMRAFLAPAQNKPVFDCSARTIFARIAVP